jgi:hypothetical protein
VSRPERIDRGNTSHAVSFTLANILNANSEILQEFFSCEAILCAPPWWMKAPTREMGPCKWAPIVAAVASMVIGAAPAFAKSKHSSQSSSSGRDQITIESHVSLTDGPVIRFVTAERNGRSYVYAERGAGKGITLIDVTQPEHPEVLGEVSNAQTGTLLTVAGAAALANSSPALATQMPAPQTIQILDLSNPASPKVTRRFEGVTAMEKMPSRGVILLANGEGIWILSEHIAEDPAAEQRYARKVVYGESRY